jgi:hypothetical protein
VVVKTFKDAKCTMHIGGLPSGMYILKVSNNNKTLIQKVIKQ